MRKFVLKIEMVHGFWPQESSCQMILKQWCDTSSWSTSISIRLFDFYLRIIRNARKKKNNRMKFWLDPILFIVRKDFSLICTMCVCVCIFSFPKESRYNFAIRNVYHSSQFAYKVYWILVIWIVPVVQNCWCLMFSCV